MNYDWFDRWKYGSRTGGWSGATRKSANCWPAEAAASKRFPPKIIRIRISATRNWNARRVPSSASSNSSSNNSSSSSNNNRNNRQSRRTVPPVAPNAPKTPANNNRPSSFKYFFLLPPSALQQQHSNKFFWPFGYFRSFSTFWSIASPILFFRVFIYLIFFFFFFFFSRVLSVVSFCIYFNFVGKRGKSHMINHMITSSISTTVNACIMLFRVINPYDNHMIISSMFPLVYQVILYHRCLDVSSFFHCWYLRKKKTRCKVCAIHLCPPPSSSPPFPSSPPTVLINGV